MRPNTVFSLAFLTILTLLMSGCSSSGSSNSSAAFLAPYKIEVNIIPSDDINVYSDGSAHPVAIRIYQLREIGAFKQSEFLALYNQDRSVLEDALIDVTKVSPVIPGKSQKIALDVQQETRYLAVLAEFANYDKLETKSFVSLVEKPDEHPVFIRITNTKISIEQPVDDSWW